MVVTTKKSIQFESADGESVCTVCGGPIVWSK